MNFSTLVRAYDTFIALRDAMGRFKNPSAAPPETSISQTTAAQGLAGQIETRLTNVVVAALKEAFDRDHARLELERAQVEEERRRAEEAMRLEMRRQAIDRELARLRLLAGTALIGWIGSLIIPFVHPSTIPSRVVLGAGWALLLAALAAAFDAQGKVNAQAGDRGARVESVVLPMWLMIAGLGATAISLLL